MRFKYENDVKKDEKLVNKLKEDDFTQANDLLLNMETLVVEISEQLTWGE